MWEVAKKLRQLQTQLPSIHLIPPPSTSPPCLYPPSPLPSSLLSSDFSSFQIMQ